MPRIQEGGVKEKRILGKGETICKIDNIYTERLNFKSSG